MGKMPRVDFLVAQSLTWIERIQSGYATRPDFINIFIYIFKMSEDHNEFFLKVEKTFSTNNKDNENLSAQQWPILAFFLVLISQTLITLVDRGKHTHLTIQDI